MQLASKDNSGLASLRKRNNSQQSYIITNKPYYRNPWSQKEDELLLDLINEYGQNWQLFEQRIVGRSSKQIQDRFINVLDPTINRKQWHFTEDIVIIKALGEIGSKWSQISKKLVGRPENMVKNRFYAVLKKKIQPKFLNKAIKSKSEDFIGKIVRDKIKYYDNNYIEVFSLFFSIF